MRKVRTVWEQLVRIWRIADIKFVSWKFTARIFSYLDSLKLKGQFSQTPEYENEIVARVQYLSTLPNQNPLNFYLDSFVLEVIPSQDPLFLRISSQNYCCQAKILARILHLENESLSRFLFIKRQSPLFEKEFLARFLRISRESQLESSMKKKRIPRQSPVI